MQVPSPLDHACSANAALHTTAGQAEAGRTKRQSLHLSQGTKLLDCVSFPDGYVQQVTRAICAEIRFEEVSPKPHGVQFVTS